MWIRHGSESLINGDYIKKIYIKSYTTNYAGIWDYHEIIADAPFEEFKLVATKSTPEEAEHFLQEIAREIKQGKELLDINEIIEKVMGDKEDDFG